ncbi:tRNA 2-thiouridine synthesizing protein A [Rhizobium sp. BK313]|uniref:sulfurtransferase TusA family protein n=1 Tax=Rhizobium sp. BK313 TaxID=2587081 RepID=UPI00105C8F39|nr:sulfurtransferase TusA family protein [Rhizobium sp. BK313]MBB3456617.1 tRNA 2-thiouridine synthesizing protein A [Rhizobium sp. BK313]
MNSLDDKVYDLRGLKCPLPVLKTEKRLRSMPSGAILTVETSDPLAIIDVPHFCNENGHTLLSSDKTDGGHRFAIRKA